MLVLKLHYLLKKIVFDLQIFYVKIVQKQQLDSVYEVAQMAQLDGYKVGGSLHIVVNNQIGFTTNYLDGRSSTYCTDIAKVTLCPVLHVNGDDVEAVIGAIQLAIEYRQKFNKDVYIDILEIV